MAVPPPRRFAISRASPAPVISQTRSVTTASENNVPARNQTTPGMGRVRSESVEAAISLSLTELALSGAARREEEARQQAVLNALFAAQFAQRLDCPCVLGVQF